MRVYLEILKHFVLSVLIVGMLVPFSMILSRPARALTPEKTEDFIEELKNLGITDPERLEDARKFLGSSQSDPGPVAIDTWGLADQAIRYFEAPGESDRYREISLNDPEPDYGEPPVMGSPYTQLEYRYDREARALVIENWDERKVKVFTGKYHQIFPEDGPARVQPIYKEQRKLVKTHEHVFYNTELSGSQGDTPIASDMNNAVLFSTKEGIRAFSYHLMPEMVFRDVVPSMKIMPSADFYQKGAQIEALAFWDPTHDRVVTFDGLTAEEKLDKLDLSSLQIRVRTAEGEIVHANIPYNEAVTKPIHQQLPWFLSQAHIANPNLKVAQVIADILRYQQESFVEQKAIRSTMISKGLENPGSDLAHTLIQRIATHTPLDKVAGLLDRRDGEGGTKPDAFDALEASQRETYHLSTQEPDNAGKDEWTRDLQLIREGMEKDQKLWADYEEEKAAWDQLTWAQKLSVRLPFVGHIQKPKRPDDARNWRQVLADARIEGEVTGSYKSDRVLSDVAKGIRSSQRDKEKKTWGRVRALLRSTKGRLCKNILLIGGVVGLDYINTLKDGALMQKLLSFLSYMTKWATDVPIMGEMISYAASSAEFWQSNWAASLVFVGALLILQIRPIFYNTGYAISKLKGEKWSKQIAFFTQGMRLSALANYPIQWLFTSKVLRQKNLLKAIRAGVPLFGSRGVWTNPLSKKDPNKEFKAGLSEHEERSRRCLVIAALIVSEMSRQDEDTPHIDPASLLQMMQAKLADKEDLLWKTFEEMPENSSWEEISRNLYRAMQDMHDNGIGDVDSQTVEAYVKVMKEVKNDVEENQFRRSSANPVNRGIQLLRDRSRSFVTFTSDSVLPYLLVNPEGYDVYHRYHRAVIDARNAATAAHQFDVDYPFSTWFYAMSDGKNFGAMMLGDIAAACEVIANQTEQGFVYGFKGGLENLYVNPLAVGLKSPGSPLIWDWLKRDKAIEGGGFGRSQNVFQAIWYAFTNPFTQRSKHSAMGTHLKRMEIAFKGTQLNFIAGFIPRSIGMSLIALAAAQSAGASTLAALSEAGDGALSMIPRQLNFLFNKYAMMVGEAGAFIIGYVVIWGLVISHQNIIKDRAQEGVDLHQALDADLDQAIRSGDKEQMRNVVAETLVFYEEHGINLPAKFKRAPELYDLSLAQDLFRHTLESPAIRSVPNSGYQTIINLIGALVSTMLYVGLSNQMYNPDVDAWYQLGRSISFFTATYFGLKMALPVVKKTMKAVGDGVSTIISPNSCQGKMLKPQDPKSWGN